MCLINTTKIKEDRKYLNVNDTKQSLWSLIVFVNDVHWQLWKCPFSGVAISFRNCHNLSTLVNLVWYRTENEHIYSFYKYKSKQKNEAINTNIPYIAEAATKKFRNCTLVLVWQACNKTIACHWDSFFIFSLSIHL